MNFIEQKEITAIQALTQIKNKYSWIDAHTSNDGEPVLHVLQWFKWYLLA